MSKSTIQRPVPFDLPDTSREQSIEQLQGWLPFLIASALRLKQAHWNLRGARFKSVHEQLDEILLDVRDAVDDVAERLVTIGGSADGLPATVAAADGFSAFAKGLLTVEQAIDTITDDLALCSKRGRQCIAALGEVDPVSEDLAIGIVASIEKHHWMLQSQKEV